MRGTLDSLTSKGSRGAGSIGKGGEALARVHLGREDPQADRITERERVATQPTVLELASRCLDAIQVRPATLSGYQRVERRVIGPAIGHRQAADLRRAEVRAFLEPIAKRTSVHANRVRRCCGRVGLAWAEQHGIERPKKKRGQVDVVAVRNLRHILATHMRERLRVGRNVVALTAAKTRWTAIRLSA